MTTEKLTIAKLGEEKVVNYTNKKTNRPDSFNKVGFQGNEHPQQWYDFTYRGACPLVVGNQYEFEITPREYNGKTYHDAKLPRKRETDLSGIETKLLYISRNVDATLATGQMLISKLDMLVKRFENKGVLDDIEKGIHSIYPKSTGEPDFGESIEEGKNLSDEEPPLSSYDEQN